MHSRSIKLIFSFTLAALLIAFSPLPLAQAEPTNRTFKVAASSFEFSPGEISVNRGDLVTIDLTSTDVVHGLYLDGYDLQITVDPGHSQSLTFTADQSGTFRFRCSVTCGDLHPFMIGKLHVGPNILFWRGVGLAALSLLAIYMIDPFRFRNQQEKPET
jgi:heme/copper-type cytochrome/quinol oxidase subunit 2